MVGVAGSNHIDYNLLHMEFTWEDGLVCLQGEPLLQMTQVHYHQLKRLSHIAAISGCFQLFSLTAVPECTYELHHHSHKLSALPDMYKDVFAEPQALPPFQAIDHRIHLAPHSQRVNVKSECYPHSQKTEIETLVTDKLPPGIIRPSQRSFSSPILLFKKKMVLGDFVLITAP